MEKDENYPSMPVAGKESYKESRLIHGHVDSYLESCIKEAVQKSTVRGVAINDSPFKVHCMVGNKKFYHSAYRLWANMLNRCYYEPYQIKFPSYVGCSVCDEWLTFSNFLSWWRLNHVSGWQIDKDLLSVGNKIYCPEFCIFIPKKLNTFHLSSDACRGDYMIGAFYREDGNYFTASIKRNGKSNALGSFSSEIDAHLAWFEEKMKIARSYKELCESIHPDLFNCLIKKIESLRFK